MTTEKKVAAFAVTYLHLIPRENYAKFYSDLLKFTQEQEKEAFEAARKITPGENYLKAITYDIDGNVMYELAVNYKYQSIEDWRNEK